MSILLAVGRPVLLVLALGLDEPSPERPDTKAIDVAAWTATGIERLLAMQEGESSGEWPYEGVYRENGEIPTGYRVGGTAICARTLLELPGYAEDPARRAAIERALKFVVAGVMRADMGPEVASRYDVRGWGHAYALLFFSALLRQRAVPDDLADALKPAIERSLAVIAATEIPGVGGWNYSRPRGFSAAGPASPFMTAVTILALNEVARSGSEVDPELVERALDALESARTDSGTYVYAGEGKGEKGERAAAEGNCARAAVVEVALRLHGRSSPERLRAAVDQFVAHWEWLEKRRAKNGTHVPPFGIAPYYFYFGHEYAALAVEFLPEQDRAAARSSVRELLARTRAEDGTWNDRVFARSANYGTAAALRTLLADVLPKPLGVAPPGANGTK